MFTPIEDAIALPSFDVRISPGLVQATVPAELLLAPAVADRLPVSLPAPFCAVLLVIVPAPVGVVEKVAVTGTLTLSQPLAVVYIAT